MALAPIETLHLFPEERKSLLELLRSLSREDWDLPTACEGWSVHDVALHLLGDNIGKLSGSRDVHQNPEFSRGSDIRTFTGLVSAINRQNDLWVQSARRMSPRLTIDLLDITGRELDDHLRTLDLMKPGGSVDWAGPEPAPIWMDLAREYTERWHHQQHIREAVKREVLDDPRWMRPVFETFVRGLYRSLANIKRPEGTALSLTITGTAGGTWSAISSDSSWELFEDQPDHASASVTMPQETAWKLFTRGISQKTARETSSAYGDEVLTAAVFQTVSILAE